MSRAEEIKTERRRRNPNTLTGRSNRLNVDEDKLDRKQYEYRFVNDKAGRVQNLYDQDWDIASDEMGGSNGQLVGEDANGKPMTAVLMRKRKDYYNDDRAAMQRHIDELETTVKDRSDPAGGEVEGAYVPAGQKSPTTIRRG